MRKKRVLRTANSFSDGSVIVGMTDSHVSITTKLVARPYLDIQLQKTKDAAAVSLR